MLLPKTHKVVNGERQQRSCQSCLCWFHVKKAWVDILLPKVIALVRNQLYEQMCQLMHCFIRREFKYIGRKGVCQYVGGWCGMHCAWRNLWPKFGRLFSCGHVDTVTFTSKRHVSGS